MTIKELQEHLDKEINVLESRVISNRENTNMSDYWAGHTEGLLAACIYIRACISKEFKRNP